MSHSSSKPHRRGPGRAATTAPRLLYTREQTAQALGGISISSIIRLENDGRLRKVRLRGKTGQVFHNVSDIEALASGEEVSDA